MFYTVQHIAKITGGKLIAGSYPLDPIEHLLIDSRKVVSPEAQLFFAFKTSRNDGHNYINQLIGKGIRNFVVEGMNDPLWFESQANFIVVSNTLNALQALASYHRSVFQIPVIGITGSNGKTIVKEWLWQLMDDKDKVVRSPKSFNSQIGVPISVWQLNANHRLGIFEAGISLPDEMQNLEKIIKPTIGIFTNIGTAHDENFSNHLQKAKEKLNLFRHSQVLICCADYPEIIQAHKDADWSEKPRLITWSRKDSNAPLFIISTEKVKSKTIIQAKYERNLLQLEIPFHDEASVENLIHCWLTLLFLGVDHESIVQKIGWLHPVAMRMEQKTGLNHCTLIDDSYSSDLSSLGIALDFLHQQKQHQRVTVILSDMHQSGLDDEKLYRAIGNLLTSKHINRFFGIGKSISAHRNYFPQDSTYYESTEKFISDIPFLSFHDEAILIKGARAFGFEQIVHELQLQKHETVLEIDLDALIHNLNYFRSLLKRGVKTMVMAKAFSYGSGSHEIANMLQYHQADYLAVAYTDEGVELRKSGIRLPIMVMNPEQQAFRDIFRYNLEPEIFSMRTLRMLDEQLEYYNGALNLPFNIHLKLDTGMKRLGFDGRELPLLVSELQMRPHIRVASVFSHLVASSDPAHDAFTLGQIASFEESVEFMEQSLGYKMLRHILNTAGIIRFNKAQYDMVRIGIGIHGISPVPEAQTNLQYTSTFRSTLSQIKHIKEGSSIGYNRSFIANKEMTIAIVPVGYADGLSRRLSNGHYSLLVKGKPAPIVGNISMDMCMIDISGIDASEGDAVVIFSPEHPIHKMAEALNTIPYEVLTGISRRVKRVYLKE